MKKILFGIIGPAMLFSSKDQSEKAATNELSAEIPAANKYKTRR